MQTDQIAPALAKLSALAQVRNTGDVNALQQHLMETQIRVSDLGVRLQQLRDQQARASNSDRVQFDKVIADAQHENIVAVSDLQMTERRLAALTSEAPMPPPRDALIDRSMIEETATGVFLLMIPIAFALARRIWVRSGARPQQPPVIDLESSPRMQRLEEAIESIAIEVERIGEAQRFATKLLTERPEPVVNRALPTSAPMVRKTPGTITPH
ncbi:MAG: hypothetical protein ABI664_07530 [bacterium]